MEYLWENNRKEKEIIQNIENEWHARVELLLALIHNFGSLALEDTSLSNKPKIASNKWTVGSGGNAKLDVEANCRTEQVFKELNEELHFLERLLLKSFELKRQLYEENTRTSELIQFMSEFVYMLENEYQHIQSAVLSIDFNESSTTVTAITTSIASKPFFIRDLSKKLAKKMIREFN